MTVGNLLSEVAQRRTGFLRDSGQFVTPELGNKVFDLHSRIFAPRKDIVKAGLCVACIPPPGRKLLNNGMNKHICRKQWLLALKQKEGSIAGLAAKLETDPNYLSSLLGPKGRRKIGDELARRAEEIYRLPSGALDYPSEGVLKVIKALDGLTDDQLAEVVEFIRFKKSVKN